MKRLLGLIFLLALLFFIDKAWTSQEVTTSTVITIASRALNDTGTYVTPESVNVIVYHEGSEAFDAWFNSSDGECSELNNQLVFFDAFGDIDGDAGTGIYWISANFKNDDDEFWVNTCYELVDTTTQSYGSYNYWKIKTYGDSTTQAIADANKANFKATGFATHSAADVADAVWDEPREDHTTGNTFGGDALDNDTWTDTKAGYLDEAVSGIDDNPWDAATRSLTEKTGFVLAANGLDSDTSFSNLQAVATDINNKCNFISDIKEKTDGLPSDPADQSLIMDEVGNLDGWSPPDSFTIDISNAWGLGVILTNADAETLLVIRDYAHATQESINAHAPHGDNWATAGAGDTTEMKTMMQQNWDSDTDGLLSVEAGAGGADTLDIKTMLQHNWDSDTDGELTVELPDSFTVDISNLWPFKSDLSTFDASSDEVTVGTNNDKTDYTLTGAEKRAQAETTYVKFTEGSNEDEFKTDISGLDDNPWDNAKSDTASGMGDWFADWFKSDYWLTATGFATHSPLDVWTVETRKITHFDEDDMVIDLDGTTVGDVTDSVETSNPPAYQGNGGDTADVKTMLQNNWDPDTDGLLSVEAGAGGADTADIKTMMQQNWDSDTDGEFSVETSTGADSGVMKQMIKNNWDTDDDGQLLAELAGAGSNTVTIYVKNYADSSGLNGFNIEIEDSAGGGFIGEGSTNSSGYCTFGLDDGTYTIYLSAPGWTITSPVYRTISGEDVTLTYYATGISPSPPPGDSLCVVYGYVYNKDGTAAVGAKVEIWMDKTGVTYHGAPIDVQIRSVEYTNTSGYFEFDAGIYPNDVLQPENTLWQIRVTSKNENRLAEKRFEVPIADSYEVPF
jgi:hypothetical protein